MGGVGAPDDQLAALGADPAEQPRHRQLTGVVGVGATGPVVRDAEVAHSESGQGIGQPDDLTGHVGLHGDPEVEPVPPLQIERRREQLVQLVGGAHLGVEVERHRRQRDPVLPDPVQQLGVPGRRPVGQPLGDGVERLLVPAEPGGLAQGVGVPHQPQRGVEVVDVLGAHDVLAVGVADVVVAVLDQVDVVVPGPLQDRGQLDGRIGDADHQLRRAVDLGDQEPEAAGPDLLAAGGHLGAAQPDPDQRRVDRSLPAHHLQPYGLQEAVAVGRDQGLGDQSDGHAVGDGLSVHRVGDDLGPLERGVPDRAGREDGVGGHGRAFRWGYRCTRRSGRRQPAQRWYRYLASTLPIVPRRGKWWSPASSAATDMPGSDEERSSMATSRRPTITAVATHAGVSPMTVSRVLDGRSTVSPELADRVHASVAALGYRRNEQARSLRPGQRSGLVGVAISNVANPYYAQFLLGAEEVLAETGRTLMIGSTADERGAGGAAGRGVHRPPGGGSPGGADRRADPPAASPAERRAGGAGLAAGARDRRRHGRRGRRPGRLRGHRPPCWNAVTG